MKPQIWVGEFMYLMNVQVFITHWDDLPIVPESEAIIYVAM